MGQKGRGTQKKEKAKNVRRPMAIKKPPEMHVMKKGEFVLLVESRKTKKS